MVDVDRYLVTVVPTAPNSSPTAANDSTSGGDQFSQIDKDGNGMLDKSEVQGHAGVMRQWSTLDENADGRVSRQEFNASMAAPAER